MKPRLRYADAFQAIDFANMKMGTALDFDGHRVTFEGEHYGNIWIRVKNKVHWLEAGNPVIGKLRLRVIHDCRC